MLLLEIGRSDIIDEYERTGKKIKEGYPGYILSIILPVLVALTLRFIPEDVMERNHRQNGIGSCYS